MIALEKQEKLPAAGNVIDAFIVAMDAEVYAFELLLKLRRAGLTASMDFAKRSMKAQMKQASKSGARFALIVGGDEVSNRTVTVKNLATSDQETIAIDDVIERIKGVTS